jgi:hypothetical protein
MLAVDHARWGQTPEDLAMSALHPRTRERFLALYDITRQSRGATRVAPRTGGHPQTVMGWLHAYNAPGPAALVYRRTGGRPPLRPSPDWPRRDHARGPAHHRHPARAGLCQPSRQIGHHLVPVSRFADAAPKHNPDEFLHSDLKRSLDRRPEAKDRAGLKSTLAG